MTLDEMIDALQRTGVDPGHTVDVWIDESADDRATIRDIITDSEGVHILINAD